MSDIKKLIKSALWLCAFAAVIILSGNVTAGAKEKADTFTISNITYLVTKPAEGSAKGTVTVVGISSKKSVTSAAIKATVSHDGSKYTVNAVGDAAFAFSKLTAVTLPDSVKSIGKACFYGSTELQAVSLGRKLSSIGEGAFSYCDSLSDISISKDNTHFKIIDGAVFSVSGKTLYSAGAAEGKFELPDTCTSVKSYAFEGNSRVTCVVCNEGLKTICSDAFYNCTGLKQIYISSTVSSIKDNPFRYCEALDDIDCSAKNASYCVSDGLLLTGNKKYVKCGAAVSGEYTIPSYVKYISAFAFCGNTGLNEIIIGKNVKTVREGAFYDCRNLTYVWIEKLSLKLDTADSEKFTPVFGNTSHYLEISLPYSSKEPKPGSVTETLTGNIPSGSIITNRYNSN